MPGSFNFATCRSYHRSSMLCVLGFPISHVFFSLSDILHEQLIQLKLIVYQQHLNSNPLLCMHLLAAALFCDRCARNVLFNAAAASFHVLGSSFRSPWLCSKKGLDFSNRVKFQPPSWSLLVYVLAHMHE